MIHLPLDICIHCLPSAKDHEDFVSQCLPEQPSLYIKEMSEAYKIKISPFSMSEHTTSLEEYAWFLYNHVL